MVLSNYFTNKEDRMTGFPSKATVEALRKLCVDDAGSAQVHGDTGSSLSVVFGEDWCSIIS